MQRSLTAIDVNFLSLQSAIFCVQCELLSENNTPQCLGCGRGAVLSLSRGADGESYRGRGTGPAGTIVALHGSASCGSQPPGRARGWRASCGGKCFHSPSCAASPSWANLCAAGAD